MNTEQKSLKLAELMNMGVGEKDGVYHICAGMFTGKYHDLLPLEPYRSTLSGLSQFAAILLKFPEVMTKICYIGDGDGGRSPENARIMLEEVDFTQANILDEILRMNGVDIND